MFVQSWQKCSLFFSWVISESNDIFINCICAFLKQEDIRLKLKSATAVDIDCTHTGTKCYIVVNLHAVMLILTMLIILHSDATGIYQLYTLLQQLTEVWSHKTI